MADFDDLGSLDDLDSLDDLGDLEEISFDDPPVKPAQQAAPQQAAPASGLGAVIQDLITKRNYQQVIQIAETQKQAIERDPQVQAMVDMARTRLQQESYLLSYVEAAQQARAAGQADQAAQYLAKAREIDPNHPALQQAVQSAAPQPAAPQPAAPQPAAPQPAAPQPPAQDEDLLTLDDSAPLTFGDDSFDSDLQVEALDESQPLNDTRPTGQPAAVQPPEPAAPQPAAPQPAAPQPPADAFGGDEPLTFDGGDVMSEGGFDGAEDAETADRIQQLLAEGQREYEKDEYQSAIDVWSRIFLIDIDHAEASRRIEEARGKKDELDRQAEEIFYTALDQIEAEELEEAKASLARVLEIQPNHPTASEYLEQLEAGHVPVINRAEEQSVDLFDDGGLGDLQAASLQEPGQSMEAAVARDRVVFVKRTDRRLIGLAAAVGILVLGGVGFLALKWDDIFRNTDKPAAQAPAPRVDPIARATRMFETGKIQNAIQLLEKLTQDDPSYSEAQALIAQWKAMVETPPDEQDSGPTEEMMQRRDLLTRAAREAFEKGSYIRARKFFDRANKILPLDAEALSLRRECDFRLEPLEQQIAGFEEGKYEEILPQLWRQLDEDPENPDIELLIVDSYYNLALTDLQRGNPGGAGAKLGDALEVTPENEELQRLKLFADAYSKKSPDLLYRIFVKYLPTRA